MTSREGCAGASTCDLMSNGTKRDACPGTQTFISWCSVLLLPSDAILRLEVGFQKPNSGAKNGNSGGLRLNATSKPPSDDAVRIVTVVPGEDWGLKNWCGFLCASLTALLEHWALFLVYLSRKISNFLPGRERFCWRKRKANSKMEF